MKIDHTSMSERTKNALKRNGIFTVYDLIHAVRADRLLACHGIGPATASEAEWYIANLTIEDVRRHHEVEQL